MAYFLSVTTHHSLSFNTSSSTTQKLTSINKHSASSRTEKLQPPQQHFAPPPQIIQHSPTSSHYLSSSSSAHLPPFSLGRIPSPDPGSLKAQAHKPYPPTPHSNMCISLNPLRTHLPFTEKYIYTRLPSTPTNTVTARKTPTIRHLDKFLAAFAEHLEIQAELWKCYYTLLNHPFSSTSTCSLSLSSSSSDAPPTYYEATHPTAISRWSSDYDRFKTSDFDKRTAVLQSLSADMAYEMHQFYNDWSFFLNADIADMAKKIRRELGWPWWNVVKRREPRKALRNMLRAWEKEGVVVGRAIELFA